MTRTQRNNQRRRLMVEVLESKDLLTTLLVSNPADSGAGTFREALVLASADPSVHEIVFEGLDQVVLDSPVEFSGSQPLSIDGKSASIQSAAPGTFDLLVSSGAADLSLTSLSFDGGANGIYVPLPGTATGVVQVTLSDVEVVNSNLFGLHVSDQVEDSAAGIHLSITGSTFIGNGIGELDYDGVRVDEGGAGNIVAEVEDSTFDANGGDGLELDERGSGSVSLVVSGSSFSNNGFFNEEDLDDGLDIDEADAGSLSATIVDSVFNGNYDQGIDLDEDGDGNTHVTLLRVEAINNLEEGIKVDEKYQEDENEDPIPGTSDGNLWISLTEVNASSNSGEEGIAITEEGAGNLTALLQDVAAHFNGKEGVDISEEGAGNLSVNLSRVEANGNEDDGIQIEEADEGNLSAIAAAIAATGNDGAGFKIEQGGNGRGKLNISDYTLGGNSDDDLDDEGVTIRFV